MQKLIEIQQDYSVICDNPTCDFKVENWMGEPDISDDYLNEPCPKCGENLLTEKDYKNFLRFVRLINWINKYFSWLTYLSFTEKRKNLTVHVHDSIKIEK